MDAINYLTSDAFDDLADFPGFGYPFAAPALPGPVVTDPAFVAVVDTMLLDAALVQTFFTAAMRAAKQATERRPYVAVVGSRNALRHTLHQTGVL